MNTVIEVDDLSVRFNDYRAVCDVSFQVEARDFVTILGPNGAGKSTLLKVLLGLIQPTKGRVSVLGREPEDVPPEMVAYVPQVKTLDRTFPARTIELVYTGLRSKWPIRGKRELYRKAHEALERVGAGHLADRPLSRLSGGELQRVYLARGLVRRPKIILLDEPATGIDASGVVGLYDVLYSCQRQLELTILMVTHDWEVASHHATKVLLLNTHLIAYGKPDVALTDACLRKTFGHVGHAHSMLLGGGRND
jgi:zinc transport system ATP-binding protein